MDCGLTWTRMNLIIPSAQVVRSVVAGGGPGDEEEGHEQHQVLRSCPPPYSR